MDNNEKILFSNSFGTVSEKRIILNRKNGAEDIPLQNITSISFERKRNITVAVIYFVVAIGILIEFTYFASVPGYLIVISVVLVLLLLLAGAAYLVGHYRIKYSLSGVDKKPVKVEMAKATQGYEFINAVKQQLG